MGTRTSPTDEELLASHDTQAFGIFYDRHARTLLGYFARRTGDPQVAADLTAETFASAIVAQERYVPTGAPALAWLYAIAARRLADYQRRGAVERRMQRALAMERVPVSEEDAEMIRLLADDAALAMLAELPPDQREAVTAHVVDDRGYPELAATLHTSEAAVRQRVSRGLATLRRRRRARMSDFLTELRREVVGAHATHQRRSARSARARRWRPALAGAAALAALLVAVVIAVRSLPAPEPTASRGWSRWCASAASRSTGCSPAARCGWPTPSAPRWCGSIRTRGGWWRGSAMTGNVEGHRRGGRTACGCAPRAGATWTTAGCRGSTRARTAVADVVVTAPGTRSPSAAERSGPTAGSCHRRGSTRIDAASRRGHAPASPSGTPTGSPSRTASCGRSPRTAPSPDRRGQRADPAALAAAGGVGRDRRRQRDHRADAAGAWVLSTEQGAIFRLEGERITRKLAIDASAKPVLAATRGGLWVAAGDELRGRHRVVRIDPASGKETATVDLGAHRPQALVPVPGGLWVVCGDGTAVLIKT